MSFVLVRINTFIFSLVVIISSQLPSAAEDSALQNAIWEEPFTPITESDGDVAFCVIAITNDIAARQKGSAKLDSPTMWCRQSLERSVNELQRQRPKLSKRVQLQHCAVGLPLSLTGGKPGNHPARVIVAVTDKQYRLLSYCIGVPDGESLVSLAEDAEETLTLFSAHKNNLAKVRSVIAQRSEDRLDRIWSGVLREQASVLGYASESEFGEHQSTNNTKTQSKTQSQVSIRLGLLSDALLEPYQSDASQRFGLSNESDVLRLITLEQHIETRRSWCEATIPFLTGISMQAHWQPFVETIWKVYTISPLTKDAELLAWWESLGKDQSVTIELTQPPLTELRPWPPRKSVNSTKKIGVDWSDVHAQAIGGMYLKVSLSHFSVLMNKYQLPSVNILGSSPVRYAFFSCKSHKPILIRESDSPGKILGMLQRSLP